MASPIGKDRSNSIADMTTPFVPDDFDVHTGFTGPGFRLEPLGPEHNERDHEAWMSSIDHIWSTPGFPHGDWPKPMSLEDNHSDLVRHADDFANRRGFTYSILDSNGVIGCVYIYPSRDPSCHAIVSSWVTKSRADMDRLVWETLTGWLTTWPFPNFSYDSRD